MTHKPTAHAVQAALEDWRRLCEPSEAELIATRIIAAKRKFSEAAAATLAGDTHAAELATAAYAEMQAALAAQRALG